jgi:hypothetical protein
LYHKCLSVFEFQEKKLYNIPFCIEEGQDKPENGKGYDSRKLLKPGCDAKCVK